MPSTVVGRGLREASGVSVERAWRERAESVQRAWREQGESWERAVREKGERERS